MKLVYVFQLLNLYVLPAGLFVVVCCVVGCGSVDDPPKYYKKIKEKLAKSSRTYSIFQGKKQQVKSSNLRYLPNIHYPNFLRYNDAPNPILSM